LTRLVGNTYGCTDVPEEISYTTQEETYQRAKERGIIPSDYEEHREQAIARKDFYDLLNKTLNVRMCVGGITRSYTTWAKKIGDRPIYQDSEDEPESVEEPTESPEKIALSGKMEDDFSVHWTVPEEWKTSVISILGVGASGETYFLSAYGAAVDSVRPQDMLWLLAQAGDDPLVAIRVERHERLSTLAYGEILLPNISVVTEGDRVEPKAGTYFKKDAYYLFAERISVYRKAEYNSVEYHVARFESGREMLPVLFPEFETKEIHASEINITGNSKDGFTVSMTPESEGCFAINLGAAGS